jgi:hypothetical protein
MDDQDSPKSGNSTKTAAIKFGNCPSADIAYNPVGPDSNGNCQFSSIAHQLSVVCPDNIPSGGLTGSDVRTRVVEYLQNPCKSGALKDFITG